MNELYLVRILNGGYLQFSVMFERGASLLVRLIFHDTFYLFRFSVIRYFVYRFKNKRKTSLL